MILMKEYISLTTDAMKIGKRHFYSDHSSSCKNDIEIAPKPTVIKL